MRADGRELARRAEDVCGWINGTTQEELEPEPFAFTADDAYAIKLAASKIGELRLVYLGQGTIGTAYDLAGLLAQFTGIA